MTIRITTGDWGGDYEAPSGKEAVKAFFRDILAGRIKISQLGVLGQYGDADNPIFFRIAPALFIARKISMENLFETFDRAGLEFEPADVAWMITQDAWMVEQAIGPLKS